MITATRLFYRRVLSEWKFQYGVWKTALDWTVCLYIVIPALLFAADNYLLLWKSQFTWLQPVPLYGFLLPVFLFARSGTIRTFLEEGDQLFLLRREGWIKKIMALGIAYSAIGSFTFNLFFFLLLAPFLMIHYKFSTIQFALLFVFVFLFKMNWGIAKQLFEQRFDGWKKGLLAKANFILMGIVFFKGIPFLIERPAWFFLSCLPFFMLLGFFITMRISLKGVFFDDIAREQRERLKYASFLLRRSGVSIKMKISPRSRPALFRSPNRLFRERNTVNVLVELCLKSVLRNTQNILFYLQLVIVCIALVLSLPLWWKLLLWPVMAAILTSWANLHWKEFISEDFAQLFRWKPEDKRTAADRSMRLLMLPGFLLISLVAGFQVYSWTGAWVALPAGVILGHYVNKIFRLFLDNHGWIHFRHRHPLFMGQRMKDKQ